MVKINNEIRQNEQKEKIIKNIKSKPVTIQGINAYKKISPASNNVRNLGVYPKRNSTTVKKVF